MARNITGVAAVLRRGYSSASEAGHASGREGTSHEAIELAEAKRYRMDALSRYPRGIHLSANGRLGRCGYLGTMDRAHIAHHG